MDAEVRALEKQFAAEPDNRIIKKALIRAWDRAGIENARTLFLAQSEWCDRFKDLEDELSEVGYKRFKCFLEHAFRAYPALEKVLYQAAVPHFMDGDPTHDDWSILISPRWFCSYGIFSYDEVYENWDPYDYDFWKKEKAGDFTYKPGVLNSGLTIKECSELEEQFWKFSRVMHKRWGTNTRVWIYRENHEHDWLPKGVNWNREPYDAGY